MAYAHGKDRINLILKNETIAYIRKNAPSNQAFGVVMDDLVKAAKGETPESRIESKLDELLTIMRALSAQEARG